MNQLRIHPSSFRFHHLFLCVLCASVVRSVFRIPDIASRGGSISIGVAGRVWNDARGVSIDAFGQSDLLHRFIDALQIDAPPAARVRSLIWSATEGNAPDDFPIMETYGSTATLPQFHSHVPSPTPHPLGI